MTVRDLFLWGREKLARAHCPDPETDARLLLYYAADADLTWYALHGGDPAEESVQESYKKAVERRALREPLQYITGTAPFYGYSLRVTPDVLIPRFDTETLVEAVLGILKPSMRLLDICTGSGCIPAVISKEFAERTGGGDLDVTASDISEGALHVARENAERLGVDIHFVKSDLFSEITGIYDIITANPPYIKEADISLLDQEVRAFEPHTALSGREDGLYFYRKITAEASDYLCRDGIMVLEIGADQAESVSGMLRGHGFRDIRLVRDLGGRDRVLMAKRKT